MFLGLIFISMITLTDHPKPQETLPDGFPLIAVGEWPDDGWKPPPMHTIAEQREIREHHSVHICELTNKGLCANFHK